MTRSEVITIRRALDRLPANCRYHGANTAPDSYHGVNTAPDSQLREACCDTGVDAQRRKLAMTVLDTLAPGETP